MTSVLWTFGLIFLSTPMMINSRYTRQFPTKCPYELDRNNNYHFRASQSNVQNGIRCTIHISAPSSFQKLKVTAVTIGRNDWIKLTYNRGSRNETVNVTSVRDIEIVSKSVSISIFHQRSISESEAEMRATNISNLFFYDFTLEKSRITPVQPTQLPVNQSEICHQIFSRTFWDVMNFQYNYRWRLPSGARIDLQNQFIVCECYYNIDTLNNEQTYQIDITILRATPKYTNANAKLSFTVRNETQWVPLFPIKRRSYYFVTGDVVKMKFKFKILNDDTISIMLNGSLSRETVNCTLNATKLRVNNNVQIQPLQTVFQFNKTVEFTCMSGYYPQNEVSNNTCGIAKRWAVKTQPLCRTTCGPRQGNSWAGIVRREPSGMIYSVGYPANMDIDLPCDITILLEQGREVGLSFTEVMLMNAEIVILSDSRKHIIRNNDGKTDIYSMALSNEVRINVKPVDGANPSSIKFAIRYESQWIKMCDPPQIQFGSSNITKQVRYGAVAYITCSPYHILRGDFLVRCIHAEWKPVLPQCAVECCQNTSITVTSTELALTTPSFTRQRSEKNLTCSWILHTNSPDHVVKIQIFKSPDMSMTKNNPYISFYSNSANQTSNCILADGGLCNSPYYLASDSIMILNTLEILLEHIHYKVIFTSIELNSLCPNHPTPENAIVHFNDNPFQVSYECKKGLLLFGSKDIYCTVSSSGRGIWMPSENPPTCKKLCSILEPQFIAGKCHGKVTRLNEVIKLKIKYKTPVGVLELTNVSNTLIVKYIGNTNETVCQFYECALTFKLLNDKSTIKEKSFYFIESIQEQSGMEMKMFNQTGSVLISSIVLTLIMLCFLVSMVLFYYHNQYYYPYTGWVARLKKKVSNTTEYLRQNSGNVDRDSYEVDDLTQYKPPLNIVESRMNQFVERNSSFKPRGSVPPKSFHEARRAFHEKRQEQLVRTHSDLTDRFKVIGGSFNAAFEGDPQIMATCSVEKRGSVGSDSRNSAGSIDDKADETFPPKTVEMRTSSCGAISRSSFHDSGVDTEFSVIEEENLTELHV